MRIWSAATLKSLVMPGAILLACVALLAHSGWFTLALPALSFLRYCALIGGMLLAWRFHSSRAFLALVTLFLAEQAIAGAGASGFAAGMPGHTVLETAALLVPLNFLLVAVMHERGITVAGMAPMGMLLFIESVIVSVRWRAAEMAKPPGTHHPISGVSLTGYATLALALAGIFLLGRFLLTRKIVDSSLLWSLGAFYFALNDVANPRLSTLYFATAACILAASIIENSYLLAYHDELTMLPSRRAFNDAMLRLQEPYSIAVVDIDHFKRFNDTYGHDVGDQVLRLVASNLAHVTGGGEAYRCGGEEFTIIFPGKTTAEVVDHLENLRATIEASEFRMRGADRRQVPRGPDRRNERTRTRPRKGDTIRQLAQEKASQSLSVTVSIGVATSSSRNSHPDIVQEAADKALYKAKANGRNRVETAGSQRGRSQAADIA
jgi:diguanylate cyclase (GGDEF)-like protein